MDRILCCLLAALVFISNAPGQSPAEMATAAQAEQDAAKAFAAKNNGGFLASMEKANTARPNHPRLIYNLARAYAANGRGPEAMTALGRLAEMGLVFDIERNEHFGKFNSLPEWPGLLARFAENRRPLNKSKRALELNDKALIAESVAYLAKTKTFYVGSVHQRKIVSIGPAGTPRDFSSPKDGLWSVLGMKADAQRGWLWVCTAAIPQMQGYDPALKGMSAVFKYDLRSGRLLQKYDGGEGPHLFGDLEIGADGTVYISDSGSPAIYKIDPKKNQIEEFVSSDRFVSLQGLVITDLDSISTRNMPFE